MPLLAAWIGNLIVSLVSFFTVILTKRIAIALAVIAAVVTVTATFIGAMEAVIAGVVYVAPTELVMAWGWLVPDNLDNCIVAIITGHVLRWAYDWNVKVLQLKMV